MKRAIVAGLILTALVMLVAHLEYRFAPPEQAMRSTYLRSCDATVSDGQHYGKMPDARCYFFKSAQ